MTSLVPGPAPVHYRGSGPYRYANSLTPRTLATTYSALLSSLSG